VEDQTRTEGEIKKAERYEALKQMLLRLLDDAQIQQKIVTLLRRWFGAHPRE
jgi:hypothetical protein